MPPDIANGIYLSNGALLALSPLALAILGAFGVLYRSNIEMYRDTVKYERESKDRILVTTEKATDELKRAIDLVEQNAGRV